MIHGRPARAVGAARIASCTEWNWPLPSAATTASAHAGQPGGGAALAVAAREKRAKRRAGAKRPFMWLSFRKSGPRDAARAAPRGKGGLELDPRRVLQLAAVVAGRLRVGAPE